MRRTALIRKTPLSKARARAKTLDPAKSLAYASSREALLERARGKCEICTAKINLATMHAHHRRARSAGQRDDGLANLLALCSQDHNGGNHSIHALPFNAVAHGRIISKYDQRKPCQVPVALAGGWFLLGDDGSRVPLPGWTVEP